MPETIVGVDAPVDRTRSHDGRRRVNLGRVVDLARIYRDCDLKSLARELGRDPTRIIPETGIPKVDLIARLAGSLEWSIPEVIRAIRSEPERHVDPVGEAAGFEANRAAVEHARSMGRREEAVRLAGHLAAGCGTPDHRAVGFILLGETLESCARFDEALDTYRAGGRLKGDVAPVLRSGLEVRIAGACLELGQLEEACDIARELAERTKTPLPVRARAHQVKGEALRRWMRHEIAERPRLALAARAAFRRSASLHRRSNRIDCDPRRPGALDACRGGLLECATELGRVPVVSALRLARRSGTSGREGATLASQGGWMLTGAGIAERHLGGERRRTWLHRFAVRLRAIAEALDDWSCRAAALTLQHRARTAEAGAERTNAPWPSDPAELRILIRTMGRVASFRATGWRILAASGTLEEAVKSLPRGWKRGSSGGSEENLPEAERTGREPRLRIRAD